MLGPHLPSAHLALTSALPALRAPRMHFVLTAASSAPQSSRNQAAAKVLYSLYFRVSGHTSTLSVPLDLPERTQ